MRLETDFPTVVFVHGLWMTGIDMAVLRRRVRRCGFAPVQFRYPTVRAGVAENAARLDRFIRGRGAPAVHLVGHSLGGLVIQRLFRDFPGQPPGRVVTLGTPYGGSLVAQRLGRYALARAVMGESLRAGLLGEAPPWPGDRELGVIAGRIGIGVGMVVSGLARPNDGTVAVRETLVPGMTDHITVPTSHTLLLFSAAAARQVCSFLATGRFVHEAAAASC